MNRTLLIVLSVLVLVIVAGGSFYGGMVYGKSQIQAVFPAGRQQGAFAGTLPEGMAPGTLPDGVFPGAGQRAAQGGALFGQIQEISDGVIVVTGTDGKQTRVTVAETTLIEKQASVTLADLEIGETVMVSGSRAADGSVIARSVQVGAAGRFGLGGAMGSPLP